MSPEEVRPPDAGGGHCAADDHCVTCSDAAVLVRVTRVLERGMALVDTGAGEEEVSVALVPAGAVVPGAALLVHAGEAIGVPR